MIKQEEIKKKRRCFGRDIGKMLCIGAGTGVVTFILLFLCGTLFGGGFSNGLEMAKNGLFLIAALSIAVMDREGVYGKLLKNADLCVRSMQDGLDLLLYPGRIIAGLRG